MLSDQEIRSFIRMDGPEEEDAEKKENVLDLSHK